MSQTPFKHAVIRPGGLHDDEIHLCDTCAGADTCEHNWSMIKGQNRLWSIGVRTTAMVECSDYEEAGP